MTIHWGLKTRIDLSVQETECIYIGFFFTSDPLHCPTVLSTFTTAGALRVVVFLLYCGSQIYKCITATYLSNEPLTLYLQAQLGVSMVHIFIFVNYPFKWFKVTQILSLAQ